MIITKNRICKPARYLLALKESEGFYAAAHVTHDTLEQLQRYGLQEKMESWIPAPLGFATRFNADGKWKIRKDLPKEERVFECVYDLPDWNHTGWHSGVSWYTRKCYRRELIKPAELAFTLEGNMLYSPLLHNVDGEMERIKLAINVLLEMLGNCTIVNADKCPAQLTVAVRSVPWEILRSGSQNEADWRKYLEHMIERRSKAQRNIIQRRHELLRELKPDFCVLGKQNFSGYIVYAFEQQGLYIFECDKVDNATYVFKGDWETASQLTKTEILVGGLHEARIFHTEKWQSKIEKTILTTDVKKA